MTGKYPHTPLAWVVDSRCDELGIDRLELMRRVGFSNPWKGIKKLTYYLACGHHPSVKLARLPAELGIPKRVLERAIERTEEKLENKRLEKRRQYFRPLLLVQTQSGVVFQQFLNPMFGNRMRIIPMPPDFQSMKKSEQIRLVSRIVRKHFRSRKKMLGFVIPIDGYYLQRTFDQVVVFNTNGTVREERKNSSITFVFDRGRLPSVFLQ